MLVYHYPVSSSQMEDQPYPHPFVKRRLRACLLPEVKQRTAGFAGRPLKKKGQPPFLKNEDIP